MLFVPAAERTALVDELTNAGCVFAWDEITLLLRVANDARQLADWVARRVAGEPVELIVGFTEFDGHRIAVGPRVFVPRQRSTLVVREAVATLSSAGRYVDLCTGSGAIAAAVRARRADVQVVATDIDADAVECARRNLPGCVVRQGDLFEAVPSRLRGAVDVLSASAPYVPADAESLMPREAREFEPPLSRRGGADGLVVVRRIVAGLDEWLSPAGVALLEVGDSQGGRLIEACSAAGFAADMVSGVEGGYAVRIRRA